MKVLGRRATKCGTQGVDGVYRGRNRPCADGQATGREGKRKEAKEKMLTPSVVSARSRIESPVVSVRSLVGLGGLSFAFFFGSNAAVADGCCGFAPNRATGASPPRPDARFDCGGAFLELVGDVGPIEPGSEQVSR